MENFEVETPILNTPYDEPAAYWLIEDGKMPEKMRGRRPAGYWYRSPQAPEGEEHAARDEWRELALVNLVRARIAEWRTAGRPGITRTTRELLEYWGRDGRQTRLFFAQRDAAEAIVFLNEARADFCKGSQCRSTIQATSARRSDAMPARWRPGRGRPRSWRCSPPGAS